MPRFHSTFFWGVVLCTYAHKHIQFMVREDIEKKTQTCVIMSHVLPTHTLLCVEATRDAQWPTISDTSLRRTHGTLPKRLTQPSRECHSPAASFGGVAELDPPSIAPSACAGGAGLTYSAFPCERTRAEYWFLWQTLVLGRAVSPDPSTWSPSAQGILAEPWHWSWRTCSDPSGCWVAIGCPGTLGLPATELPWARKHHGLLWLWSHSLRTVYVMLAPPPVSQLGRSVRWCSNCRAFLTESITYDSDTREPLCRLQHRVELPAEQRASQATDSSLETKQHVALAPVRDTNFAHKVDKVDNLDNLDQLDECDVYDPPTIVLTRVLNAQGMNTRAYPAVLTCDAINVCLFCAE